MDLHETQHRKAQVIIGKNGLSLGTIKLVQDLAKKNNFVKIKILKAALTDEYTKEILVKELVTKTNLHLIEIRGNSAIVAINPHK